jgi:F0F1-type ATP synthase membrane subunit b/b'
MNTAHTNSGILCIVIPGALIFKIVVMKFIAPKIDEIPARCKEKIAKSIDPPEWNSIEDNGG